MARAGSRRFLADLERREIAAGRMAGVALDLEVAASGEEVARLAAGGGDGVGLTLADRVHMQAVEAGRQALSVDGDLDEATVLGEGRGADLGALGILERHRDVVGRTGGGGVLGAALTVLACGSGGTGPHRRGGAGNVGGLLVVRARGQAQRGDRDQRGHDTPGLATGELRGHRTAPSRWLKSADDHNQRVVPDYPEVTITITPGDALSIPAKRGSALTPSSAAMAWAAAFSEALLP